jgi:hypothetical protein
MGKNYVPLMMIADEFMIEGDESIKLMLDTKIQICPIKFRMDVNKFQNSENDDVQYLWNQLKDDFDTDDQIWFCNSSRESWMALAGRCYLAHVKKNEIHKIHFVAIN